MWFSSGDSAGLEGIEFAAGCGSSPIIFRFASKAAKGREFALGRNPA